MSNTAQLPTETTALSTARVAHVAMRIRDRDASIAWYRDKLGMQVVRAFVREASLRERSLHHDAYS